MSRSKWKGPYVDSTAISIKLTKHSTLNKQKIISRNSEILPGFVGKAFNVYNGKSYVSIVIHEEMVGNKFGEFVFTRKSYVFKKKLNTK